MSDIFDICESSLNNISSKLNEISIQIWKNPELAHQENLAHKLLTDFLGNQGLKLEQHYVNPTGFKAEFVVDATDDKGDRKLPHICFLCEYDALPELGHAAGHNLCAIANIAAALAVKQCIQEGATNAAKISVLGTPAENNGGGKIELVAKDCFADMDCVLMLSPLNCNMAKPEHYALVEMNVIYKGKAAHSSAFPWEGRNALDAAVACYNNISLLRHNIKPTWSVNGIITEGGMQPNVIPHVAKLRYWLRAPEHTDLVLLQQRCTACVVAAAKATNTEASYSFDEPMYHPMKNNNKLAELYEAKATSIGMVFNQDMSLLQIGSTDMGNVSQEVPSLNPGFDIGTEAALHSVAFKDAAGSTAAHDNTMKAAKALALAVCELINNGELLQMVRDEFQEQASVEALTRKTSHSSLGST